MKKLLLVILFCFLLTGCSEASPIILGVDGIPDEVQSIINTREADGYIIMYRDNDAASMLRKGEDIDSVLLHARQINSCIYILTDLDLSNEKHHVLRAYDSMGNSKDAYFVEEYMMRSLVEEYLTNHYIRTVAPDIVVNSAFLFTSDETSPAHRAFLYYDTNYGPYIYMAWSFNDQPLYLLPLDAYREIMSTYIDWDFSAFILTGVMEPYDVSSWKFAMNVWYTPWIIGGIVLLAAAGATVFWIRRKTKRATHISENIEV